MLILTGAKTGAQGVFTFNAMASRLNQEYFTNVAEWLQGISKLFALTEATIATGHEL